MWRNTHSGWGLIHIIVHWLSAVTVFSLFGLGVWMVTIDYYNEWYYVAPETHKSIGILFALLLVFRLVWRLSGPTPRPIESHSRTVRRVSHGAHILLYGLMFVVVVSGYLIPTALGKGVPVFDWFTVPATVSDIEYQADIAGDYHRWSAWALVLLAAFHLLGAIKHHVFDKDATLKRMLLPTKQ